MCNNPPPTGRDGQACEGQASQTSPCTVQCSPGKYRPMVYIEFKMNIIEHFLSISRLSNMRRPSAHASASFAKKVLVWCAGVIRQH